MRLNIDYSGDITKKGELEMDFKPLQQIDYAHRRCDDDVKLASKLFTAAKYCLTIAVCVYLWFVILDLAFTAAGA